MTECSDGRWLLLIHQIPPRPAYLRVKVWRRLQGIGAVAIKNSVYVLPRNDQSLEDFQWMLREIVEAGAEASICIACFIEGLDDEQVEDLFRTARNADYGQIAEEARAALGAALPAGSMTEADRSALEGALTRLQKRLSTVTSIDFFEAQGLEPTTKLLDQMELRIAQAQGNTYTKSDEFAIVDLVRFKGRTWVTRKGVYVDRMACSWLIRRFIDPDASFRFVSERGYRAKSDHLRFDMFEGEFTHEGDLCSFEVLVRSFAMRDKALLEIGKIVHDLDLKEDKYKKPEAAGVAALIDGIAAARTSDEDRLERASDLFDDLYEYFRRR